MLNYKSGFATISAIFCGPKTVTFAKSSFYSSNIPQILPQGILFHKIITFKPDFGQISILLIFGPILDIFPL